MSQLVVGLVLAVLAAFLLGGALSLGRQGLRRGAVVTGVLAALALVGAGLYLVPYVLDR
ncbi:hypothetical protein WDZ16_16380 [Pseudokineococcus marinus]|uniref:Uncharacterized protein n=1 Tax=Pseudokineococcus marinus TaxID=351215 RepID=A0A849BMC2_9ACTN|nr:hypothetical protein [Pseudokineococcus marinus]NNH22515.1 hypothetical protein [Pseudokineococcus marinus]